MKLIDDKGILKLAHEYSKLAGECKKVDVGSAIIAKNGRIVVMGANRTLPFSCKLVGCRRVELYGEDSKNHRLPEDCRAIHSEIDAISRAKEDLEGCTLFVTRYPCEACARAIVSSGITQVTYGRQQEISEETKLIFEVGKVSVTWLKKWDAEDTTR